MYGRLKGAVIFSSEKTQIDLEDIFFSCDLFVNRYYFSHVFYFSLSQSGLSFLENIVKIFTG